MEKALKNFRVELSGEQVFLEVFDKDNKLVTFKGGIAVPGLKLKVDGNEYSISNLSTESDLDINSVEKKISILSN